MAVRSSNVNVQAEATLVSVSYTRECSTMMVTVCPPPSYGYQDQYHHPHKCKVRQAERETNLREVFTRTKFFSVIVKI